QIKLGQLVDGGVAGGRPDGGKGGFQALAVQGLAVHPVALEGQQAASGQDKGERQPEQPAQKFEKEFHRGYLTKKGAADRPPRAVSIITRRGPVCLHPRGKHKEKLSWCSKFAHKTGRPLDFALRLPAPD